MRRAAVAEIPETTAQSSSSRRKMRRSVSTEPAAIQSTDHHPPVASSVRSATSRSAYPSAALACTLTTRPWLLGASCGIAVSCCGRVTGHN